MYYRQYDLPWSPKEEVEARFRRVVRNSLIVFAIIGLLIPFLPTPKRDTAPAALPERVVNLVLEQRKPPPPPKPLEKKEEPKPEKVKEEPKPVDKQVEAKKKAEKAMKVFDDLKDLRDNTFDKAQQANNLTNAVTNARSERNMITSATGATSGGINSAGLSRGYGSGSGPLGGHNTTQVTSNIGAGMGPETRKGTGKKGGRDESEVRQILDSNKGAVYALYSRALRDNPDLQGKVVLEINIAPTGEVTGCRIVSSDLKDPELEKKLVARIKLIHFPPRDVDALTVSYPIEFLPSG
ncbi:MAG TPA: AgmX/PglI C-terminal domain-containing protein [Steroidobacteraceae bacterium]|jgi:TonB family protein|nr:AgmX/PglI C-terminal domain-containing protein [Steroidobacteraceae bacterium]